MRIPACMDLASRERLGQYRFGDNDPVNRRDPSGYAALRDHDLAAVVDRWEDRGWWDQHGGSVVALGVGALGVVALPVGGLVGVMLAGGLLSAGLSAAFQQHGVGSVDLRRVVTDGLLAAGAVGLGFGAGGLISRFAVIRALGLMGRGVVAGTTESIAGTAGSRLVYDQPVDSGTILVALLGVPLGAMGASRVPVYRNLKPAQLGDEMAAAEWRLIRPIRPEGPEFEALVRRDPHIQWGVDTRGELRVMTRFAPDEFGDELILHHSVLFGGRPMFTSGEASVDITSVQLAGERIDNFSGHYKPTFRSIRKGVTAFRHYRLTFREVRPFDD